MYSYGPARADAHLAEIQSLHRSRQTIFLPVIGLVEASELKPTLDSAVHVCILCMWKGWPSRLVFARTICQCTVAICSLDAGGNLRNDLVGVNKDSYLVLDKLPPEYDSRVKAMEALKRGNCCKAKGSLSRAWAVA